MPENPRVRDTLRDVDSPVDDAVIAALAAIDGVLSVRAIPAES